MPADDVSDLKDVVDAINRLCETMKSSECHELELYEDCCVSSEAVATHCEPELIAPHCEPELMATHCEPELMATHCEPELMATHCEPELMATHCEPELMATHCEPELMATRCESELMSVHCEPELVSPAEVTVRTVETHRAERCSECPAEEPSELYYTASSEVSLLSDTDAADRHDDSDKEERKECVMAGHVAAMRERFESMTRTNTPCPDLLRSSSPSLDVFRNITPSPDCLG